MAEGEDGEGGRALSPPPRRRLQREDIKSGVVCRSAVLVQRPLQGARATQLKGRQLSLTKQMRLGVIAAPLYQVSGESLRGADRAKLSVANTVNCFVFD